MSKMKPNDSRKKIGIFGSTPIYALSLTTHNELKALVAIASFQGVNEKAFPSMEELCFRADLKESALSKATSGLVRKKIIGRKKRYGQSNLYYVLHTIESLEEIKVQNKRVAAMERARNKRKKSDALNQLDNLNKQDKQSLNQLDHDAINEQDDILKEQLKEQTKRTEIETFHTKVISETLPETPKSNPLSTSRLMDIKSKLGVIAKRWNQTYIDSDRCNILYEQQRIKFDSSGYSISFDTYFDNALRMLEKLSTMPLDKFSPISAVVTIESLLKFNMQQIKTIETWYNKTYPKASNVTQFPIKQEPIRPTYDEKNVEEFMRSFK